MKNFLAIALALTAALLFGMVTLHVCVVPV